jgi:ATP-binding protein involved in chromosome partitioning
MLPSDTRPVVRRVLRTGFSTPDALRVQIARPLATMRRMDRPAVTEEQIIEALRPVEDPELHRSIVDLGMLRGVDIRPGGVVGVLIALTVPGCPLKNEIERRVSDAATQLDGVESIDLEFTVMTDDEREELRRSLHGDAGASAGHQDAHGHAEGREIPFAKNSSKTRPLLISSGKGGVGKSSITTNVAVALAAQGYSVGVVDADIYGYSIPRMLGTDREPTVIDEMLLPPEAWGVRCISIGYFVPEGQAVIWRGPMLHKALEQFLTDVFWDEPDFLLIDMPPGTGDIALSLSQYLPRGEVFIVTTPQPAAQKVAALSAAMAEKVNLPVRGVIENMSWFTGDDGKRYEIFGSGGGRELADDLAVPLLGQLPLVQALREGGDDGRPVTAVDPESETARAFHDIARQIAVDLKPNKVYSDALKVI